MSENENNEVIEAEVYEPANWPGAVVMIAFFITIIVICGLCMWGFVALVRGN